MPASRLTPAEIGLTGPLGRRATLLQLSSGFCAPCRATRGLLERVVATTEGVRHVDLDVAQHPELAAKLAITQTPTVLLLDGEGTALARHEGVPRLTAVRELLDRLAPAEPAPGTGPGTGSPGASATGSPGASATRSPGASATG